ncbi:hypothetical protein ACFLW8_02910 [Chloroflexota bacterium]
MKSLQNIKINTGNSVIVIMDAQNEFLKPDGKWYSATSASLLTSNTNTTGSFGENVE